MKTLQLPLSEGKIVWVYVLCDPTTERVRYVGITARPRARLREHCKEDAHTHRGYWIQGLITRGMKPTMRIVEVTTDDAWEERERWWIAHYRAQGESLTNATDGGHGALNPILKTREKLAKISKARWADPDLREKIIAGMHRTQQTDAERERKSKVSHINAQRPEHRAQFAVALTERWQDPEFREQQRRRASESARAQWADPAHRQRVAEANRRTIMERMKDPEYAARRSANGRAGAEKARANRAARAK